MSSRALIGRTSRLTAAIALLALTAACSPSIGRREGAPPSTGSPAETRAPSLDHLTPRRDSVGDTPARFTWTPVEGADSYMVGIFNEVDTLVWRQGDVREAAVVWPAESRLEPGTYFWSVTAFREGRPIAESGRAAFVVK